MKPDEKDRVMAAFARGEIDMLVSTTVVEVGVDVPNATVMVIEHAERFGLSQLHQLRGRVGRGDGSSRTACSLYQSPLSDDAKERLEAMAETTDGFVIAERDLAAARARRLLRHAAVRPADAARRRPAARPRSSWKRRAAKPRALDDPDDAGVSPLRRSRVDSFAVRTIARVSYDSGLVGVHHA